MSKWVFPLECILFAADWMLRIYLSNVQQQQKSLITKALGTCEAVSKLVKCTVGKSTIEWGEVI